ncbi:MAG: nuclear transport factor 2 family protein [Acidimicrobiia bacterium]
MNRDDVQVWLDRYVEAWRSGDPGSIKGLFTEDAVYGFRPWHSEKATVRGHDEIVQAWLEDDDAPGSWEAHYEPFAVEGDRAAATGISDYHTRGDGGETYYNCFLLRFADDGRCAEFNEFWMLRPKS